MLKQLFEKIKFKGDNSFPVFFICLIIAIVFWILNSLNKTYSYPFAVKLNTGNMPYSKRIANKIPEQVQVILRGRGFELLWFGLKHSGNAISIDLNSRNFYADKLGMSMAAEFSKQFMFDAGSIEIVSAIPDSVHIFLSSKYQKKVPVIANLKMTIKKNYGLLSRVKIYPDSIYVSGDKSSVDKITSVTTEPLILEELDRHYSGKINITNAGNQVLLSDYVVELSIPVDEFIENKISVPVIFKQQGGKRVFILPDKVDVIYKAPLKYFNNLAIDSFAVTAFREPNLQPGKLNVKLSRQPVHATVISVVPSAVSFFTEQ